MTQLVTATDGFIFPQVGDFYEAVGFDACVLVEYAGLNPFGGLRTDSIPRAGCPVMVVDFDRCRLISGGISRGREKEEEGVLFARTIYRPRANSSLAGDFFSPRREKKRFPAHAHPGNPYVFGLAGVDHDVEFPDPMPIVGIFQLIMTLILFL
ncbi:hypothetical protein B296_00042343 [Ensete ventricosum]|uniref:Uncharacterized protein n=1 Tax=Ensete ventricosum TaxID=4639 RepID=A0A426ZIU1_ENSVE|nr:hypothetical protein B296_00042343 [Ensete ventricosum]